MKEKNMERDEFMYKVLRAIQNGSELRWHDYSMTKDQFLGEMEHLE